MPVCVCDKEREREMKHEDANVIDDVILERLIEDVTLNRRQRGRDSEFNLDAVMRRGQRQWGPRLLVGKIL